MDRLKAFLARKPLKRLARTINDAISRGYKRFSANLLQLGGLAVFAFGWYTLTPWLGLVVAGVLLCFVGWAVDPDAARRGGRQ